MPIDREYNNPEEEVEEVVEPEYIVNPYTIQYDSKAQSFFKGFAPKVTGFSGLAVAGVVTALTAGIGLAGIGGLALAGVAGAGALTSGYFAFSYGVDYTRCSKRALKNKKYPANNAIARDTTIDSESKKLVENILGVIKFVKSNENEAYKFVAALNELENDPNKKTIKVDGAEYSKGELKRRIKGFTRLAYKGTKYLMQAAGEVSEVVERYRTKTNLTPKEEGKKKARWYILNQISECVRDITSKRSGYNPYKGLIIDSLHKGCLIGGSDYANNQIRDIVAINDKNKTTELYFEMYERAMLEEIQSRMPQPKTREEILAEENQKLRQANESLQTDFEIAADVAYEATNEAEQANKKAGKYQKRYESAIQRGVNIRKKSQGQGRIIDALVKGYSELEEKYNALKGLEARVDELEIQVDEAAHESALWMDKAKSAESAMLNISQYANEIEKQRNSASKAAKNAKKTAKKRGQDLSKQGQKSATTIEDLNKQLLELTSKYDGLVEASDQILAEGALAENDAINAKAEIAKIEKLSKKLTQRLKIAGQRISELNTQKQIAQSGRTAVDSSISAQLQRSNKQHNAIARQLDATTEELNRTEELLDIAVEDAVSAQELNAQTVKVRDEFRNQGRLAGAKARRAQKKADRANERAEKANKRAEEANKRASDAQQKLTDLTKTADDILTEGAKAERRAEDEKARADYFAERAESAEDTVKAVYDFAKQSEDKAKLSNEEAKNQKAKAEQAEAEKAKLNKKAERLEKEVKTLEERVVLLLKANNANEELVHNLGWDNYKLQKQLAEVKYASEADQERIDDLLTRKQELKDMVENLQATLDEIQLKKEWNQYKMQLGRARSNLAKLVNKIQTRALVTIDLNPQNQSIVNVCDYMLGCIDIVKNIDLNEKDMDDILDIQNTLKILCDSVGKGMVKLPKDTVEKASLVVRNIEVTITKKTTHTFTVQSK